MFGVGGGRVQAPDAGDNPTRNFKRSKDIVKHSGKPTSGPASAGRSRVVGMPSVGRWRPDRTRAHTRTPSHPPLHLRMRPVRGTHHYQTRTRPYTRVHVHVRAQTNATRTHLTVRPGGRPLSTAETPSSNVQHDVSSGKLYDFTQRSGRRASLVGGGGGGPGGPATATNRLGRTPSHSYGCRTYAAGSGLSRSDATRCGG